MNKPDHLLVKHKIQYRIKLISLQILNQFGNNKISVMCRFTKMTYTLHVHSVSRHFKLMPVSIIYLKSQ